MDAETILEACREVVPQLRGHSDEIERNRRLPGSVVEMLRSTGVFRMTMPQAWGGPELTSMEQVEVLEQLAMGDASAAWCAMIACDSGIYSGYLDDDVARTMFAELDMAVAGWIAPQGRANRVKGGYRVTGRWRYGSGCTHADWLVGGCRVYSDGEPEVDAAGQPRWRVIIGRPEQFEIIDTWYTTGLAGTGSCDYVAQDLFVPRKHSFSFYEPCRLGPLARPDAILRKMVGVPLGIARAALDHVRSIADERSGLPAHAGRTLSLCEMLLGSARSFAFSSLEVQWQRLVSGVAVTDHERSAVPLARYNAFRRAREVVSKLYDLVGARAIFRNESPLDRHLRDITAACQHFVAQDDILELCGELLLGDTPATPFI